MSHIASTLLYTVVCLCVLYVKPIFSLTPPTEVAASALMDQIDETLSCPTDAKPDLVPSPEAERNRTRTTQPVLEQSTPTSLFVGICMLIP